MGRPGSQPNSPYSCDTTRETMCKPPEIGCRTHLHTRHRVRPLVGHSYDEQFFSCTAWSASQGGEVMALHVWSHPRVSVGLSTPACSAPITHYGRFGEKRRCGNIAYESAYRHSRLAEQTRELKCKHRMLTVSTI